MYRNEDHEQWSLRLAECGDCGAMVNSALTGLHDKFHDAYKPSRKATYAIKHVDGSVEIQFLDGSRANASVDDNMSHIEAIRMLNATNEVLAPLYEGGETALVDNAIVEIGRDDV